MGRIIGLLTAQGVHLGQEHKRQVLALDSEFEQMEFQITALKAENLHLQAQVNPLQRDIERLKSKIQDLEGEAAAKQGDPLDENAKRLLVAVSKGFQFFKGASTYIDNNAALTEYYFGLLKKHRYIRWTFSYEAPSRCVITHDGLEYLHKHGLL